MTDLRETTVMPFVQTDYTVNLFFLLPLFFFPVCWGKSYPRFSETELTASVLKENKKLKKKKLNETLLFLYCPIKNGSL